MNIKNLSSNNFTPTIKNKFTNETLVLIYSFTMILFSLGISIILHKHLSADGAHYFVMILDGNDFTHVDWTRQFANYISQLPLVISVNLGIKDINSLILIFGVSVLMPYFLVFLLSIFALRDEDKSIIMFLLISMATVNFTSDYILAGEHHTLALLSWPILFFLLRKKPLLFWDVFFLFGLLFIYTRLYSTAIIPAVFFIFLSFWRIRNTSLIYQKLYYSIASILAMTSAVISAHSILYPRSEANKSGFFNAILSSLNTPEVIASLIFIILFFVGWLFRRQIFVRAAIVPIIIFAIYVGYTGYSINAFQSFANRSLVTTLLPLLLLMSAILHYKRMKATKAIYIIFIIFILTMVFNNIFNSMKWNQFHQQMSSALKNEIGFVRVEDTLLNKSEYRWSWTTPELSIIWSDGCVKTIILNAENSGWEPFDPHRELILKQYTCYSKEILEFETIPSSTIAFNSSEVIFNGWADVEANHRWSLGNSSSIMIKIHNPEDLKGILNLYIGTLGKQEIKLTINEHYIGSKTIANEKRNNIAFKFDKNLLIKDSVNIIKFEFPNAHKPTNGDQRVLAMALKSFSIE